MCDQINGCDQVNGCDQTNVKNVINNILMAI